MCVWAIPIAIAAGSALLSYSQQRKAASKQEGATQQSREAAYEALDRQDEEIEAQAGQTAGIRAREAMIERGKLAAIAGDSGLAGQGLQRLQNESRFTEGQDLGSIEENRKRQHKQVVASRHAADANGELRLASISQPSLIGTGLQIAGSYYNAQSKQPRGQGGA